MAERDDFTAAIKRLAADRVAHRCSNPNCRAATSGPQLTPLGSVNVGVAAHITAASPGGPRYDPSLSSVQRSHPTNAIWLCQMCAKLIDSDVVAFDVPTLRRWKATAESCAFAFVGRAVREVAPSAQQPSEEEVEILVACAEDGEILWFDAEQLGPWIAAGGRDFLDVDDPAHAAIYIEALEQLIAKRLVRLDRGTRYSLTGSGFRVARRLKGYMAGIDG